MVVMRDHEVKMYHQNVGRYNWNIVESGAKHHKPKPPQNVGSKVNLKWRMLQYKIDWNNNL